MVLCSQSLGNRRIRVDVADQAQDKGKEADRFSCFVIVLSQKILIEVDSGSPTLI